MEAKSNIDSAPDRQEQLADLVRRAASQPGLN